MKLVAILLGACLAVAAFLGGYALGFLETEPLHRFAERVDRKIAELRQGDAPEPPEVFQTVFFDLVAQKIPLPRATWSTGGGLTVWGETLLHVDQAGLISAVTAGGTIRRTQMQAPDNGLADYEAFLARPENADLTQARQIRFNDIHAARTGDALSVFLSATFFDAENACFGNRVYRTRLPDAPADIAGVAVASGDWEILFQTEPCLTPKRTGQAIDAIMAGGRLAMRGEDEIFVTVGDFQRDGLHFPQDEGVRSDSHYGKIVAIDLASGRARIVSSGHRNSQGLAFDAEGRLWNVEHGVRGGDELNLIVEGSDYGWPHVSLGTFYNGQPMAALEVQGRHTGHTKPVYSWLPSAAVSALTLLDGFDERWDGDLLVGSLSSPAYGQRLFRVRLDGDRVVFAENIRIGRRVRYVTQFGDAIAILADSNEILLLRRQERRDLLHELEIAATAEFSAPVAEQIVAQLETCAECHDFAAGTHGAGPSLRGVLGREIADTGFEGYSDGLLAANGVWTEQTLSDFLADPEAFAAGTTMAESGIDDDDLRAKMIWALGKIEELNTGQVFYDCGTDCR